MKTSEPNSQTFSIIFVATLPFYGRKNNYPGWVRRAYVPDLSGINHFWKAQAALSGKTKGLWEIGIGRPNKTALNMENGGISQAVLCGESLQRERAAHSGCSFSLLGCWVYEACQLARSDSQHKERHWSACTKRGIATAQIEHRF